MLSVLVLDRDGTLQEKKTKGIDRLYTLCNYRTSDGFEELYTWKHQTVSYVLYGKRKGKNHFENKHVLPPPLQEGTLYGHLCLIKRIEQEILSLTTEEWKQFIEKKDEPEEKQESKELKKEDYEPEFKDAR